MAIPADGLSGTAAPSAPEGAPAGAPNAPQHQSLAEQVLAAAQPQQGAPEGAEAPPKGKPKEGARPQAKADPAAQLDAQIAAEGRGKLSWNDALKRVPPDVAELMKNMQRDYTKKTQEVAQTRREVLLEREALLKGQAGLKPPESIPEYDPFDEGTINARIEAEVKRRLNEVLEPMRQEYEVQSAQESYQQFLAANPDLKTDTALRSEVQALLEKNDKLDLETAYWAAKGKQSRLAAERESATRRANKAAAETATAAPRRGASTQQPAFNARRATAAEILEQAKARHRS